MSLAAILMKFFSYRHCTEVQQWFKEFSLKVTAKAIDGAIQILKRDYANCNNNEAWNPAYEFLYQECTTDLLDSNPQIKAAKEKIRAFSKSSQYIPDDIWYIFEEVNPYLEENEYFGLEAALNFIEQGTTNKSEASLCDGHCHKRVREVAVILHMLKWGYYGPAETTAGSYLANYRREIGSYYVNSLNNKWPYHPLHAKPNELEVRLNKILVSLTEAMSSGKIRGISLLDLPAFGSKKTYLDDDSQSNAANWQNEPNFHFLNSSSGNMSKAFKEYKESTHSWRKYINLINQQTSNSISEFSPNKISNVFNHSQFILRDIPTFLRVIAGSHSTATKRKSPVWQWIGSTVFKDTVDQKIVENKGLYDKSVIRCSFNKRVVKNVNKHSPLSGGCELFQHSLTNNGLCYSFNGLGSSDIWRPSKLIEAFDKDFKNHVPQQNYAGAGTNEGNELHVLNNPILFQLQKTIFP